MKAIIILSVFGACRGIRMNDTNLVELGRYINDTITKPRGTGLQLTRDVYVYYEEMHGIRHDMQIELPYTFKTLQEVKDDGGPPHIRYDINSTVLADHFHWTGWEEEEFVGIINNTRKEWGKLLELEKEKKKKYARVGETV